VGLNGEGVAQGHGGGHPPRSGSSAGRLVRCGGRSVRAHVRGYGGEENNVCAQLKRVQNQQWGGGPLWVTPRGGRGSTGPGIPAAARERRRRTSVGRCLALCGSRGAGGACGLHASAWATCEHVGRPEGKGGPSLDE
jgi:hypothetical protein